MKSFVKIASGYILIIAAFLLAGCEAEEVGTEGFDSSRIDISGYVPEMTRTTVSGTTTSFASADNIGIYETLGKRRNVRFSYNGSTWSTSTPLYWQNGTSTHTFYGYYPYNASYSNLQVMLPILNDQTIGTALDVRYDMLIAGPYNQARSSGQNVPLQFRHAFTLLKFSITMGVLNTWTIKSMTIRGGNTSQGAAQYGLVNTISEPGAILFDLTSGAVAFSSDKNTTSTFSQSLSKTIPSVGLLGTIPVVIYAIILPGQYSNPVPAIQFTLTPLVGSDKTTSLAALPNTSFSANTMYTYNVSISGGVLTASAGGTMDETPLDLIVNQFNTYPL